MEGLILCESGRLFPVCLHAKCGCVRCGEWCWKVWSAVRYIRSPTQHLTIRTDEWAFWSAIYFCVAFFIVTGPARSVSEVENHAETLNRVFNNRSPIEWHDVRASITDQDDDDDDNAYDDDDDDVDDDYENVHVDSEGDNDDDDDDDDDDVMMMMMMMMRRRRRRRRRGGGGGGGGGEEEEEEDSDDDDND